MPPEGLGRRRRRVAVVTVGMLAVVAGACACSPASAEAATAWLCKPGLAPNPCEGSLATTYLNANGSSRVETPEAPVNPPVDCFYVYPTVSNQIGPNATATPEPEVRAIAQYQAARFGQQCRLFVPLYRQNTLISLFAGQFTNATRQIAYGDVRRAFEEYLANDNDGRGIVLLGHSQGSGMLRLLVRETFDKDPTLRRKLVSGILLGGNVTVKTGSDRGGDFTNVPVCTADDQISCVIAFSTFNATPPGDTRFGRPPTSQDRLTGAAPRSDIEVACTNPNSLKDNKESEVHPILRSEYFAPGLILAGILQVYGGLPPTAPTPYVVPADRYSARCEHAGGAHVLMARAIGGSRKLNAAPDATWGLHLVDINGGLGDLQQLVARQTQLYLGGPRLSLKLDYTRGREGKRSCARGAVVARVRGADRVRVAESKFRVGGKRVARAKGTQLRARISRARLRAAKLNRVKVAVKLSDERTRTLAKSVRACG